MTVAIVYVIGEKRDELLNWILSQDPFLLLKVLAPELDYAIPDLLKAVLCYRRAANISACISQELPLCLEVSNVNAPPPLTLCGQYCYRELPDETRCCPNENGYSPVFASEALQ